MKHSFSSHSAANSVSAPFAPPHTAIGTRGCTAIADTSMAARAFAAVRAACTSGGGGTRTCARWRSAAPTPVRPRATTSAPDAGAKADNADADKDDDDDDADE